MDPMTKRTASGLLRRVFPAVGFLFAHAPSAMAADLSAELSGDAIPQPMESFAIHGQATYVVQATDGFHAP
jgi:hypothetical protein